MNIKTDSKSSKIIGFFSGLSLEAKELLDELKKENNSIDSKFQYKMFELLNNLKKYNPTKLYKINTREETLNDAEKLYKNSSNVIKAFEKGFFPFNYGFQKEKSDMSDKALTNWLKVS